MEKNKLCLGTVQFGLNYGIKNELGRQPSNQESSLVLKMAIENGISYFDTASAYGNAEQVLGNFEIGKYPVQVISKLKPDLQEPLQENVLVEIQSSLKRLGVSSLDGYMLHRAEDFYKSGIMAGLSQAKELGLIRHIGVSIYEPEDALNVVKDRRMDYIQVPYNVFDQRLDETDFFEIAEKNQVKVFARSAFLQGLLLMDEDQVPDQLIEARPWIKQFRDTIHPYGFSPVEAAFLFSYCHPGIFKVVFGVETKSQLQENLHLIAQQADFGDCYQVLKGRFHEIQRKLIIPSLWN